jgi:hypothetical protein
MRNVRIIYGIFKGLFLMTTGVILHLCHLIALPYLAERILSVDMSHAKQEGLALLISLVITAWFFILYIRGAWIIYTVLRDKGNPSSNPA